MLPDTVGEYSALVAAGSLDFGEALRLVRKRGNTCSRRFPRSGCYGCTVETARRKLDAILASLATEVVSAANLNSPDQVVIAGHAQQLAELLS